MWPMRLRGEPPELCIHYDPNVISLGKVRVVAGAVGAVLTDRIGYLLLGTDAMHARTARSLKSKLEHILGVVEAEVNAGGTIRLEFDQVLVHEDALRSTLSSLGNGAHIVVNPEAEATSHVGLTSIVHGDTTCECGECHVHAQGHDHIVCCLSNAPTHPYTASPCDASCVSFC